MKLKSRKFWKKIGGGALVVPGVLVALRGWGAESVLMSPPPVSTQTAAAQDDATNNQMSVFIPSYQKRDNTLPEPLTFGPVVVRPHPYYQFLYSTGIQNGPNNTEHSIIQSFSPGFAVDFGRFWTVDYTPTIQFYSNRAFKNTVNQAATLTGGVRYEDWVFNLSQSFVQSDSPLVETAAQTQYQTYDTEFSAACALSGKISEETDLSQIFNLVSGLQDSRTWSVMEWLNYEFNKRLIVGVGAGGGYAAIEADGGGASNPDQAFEQMQARVQWRATDKISLSLNGGLQEQEYLASGYNDELNPTFGASIQYAPFDHTQITLAASRSVSSSDYFIIAQSTESTLVSLSMTQRLLEKYSLTAGLGYTHEDYTEELTVVPIGTVRTDDTYSFNVRLARTFLKRGNVAVTYQYSDNRSTEAGYSYFSSQIGFEVGFTY